MEAAMPLDDREKNFEKALSSRLQATCPDAETLAAYHERALAPDEMISWKKHIASCTGCQEVLAQLEHTDELVLRDEQELTVAAAMSRRLVSGVKPAAPLPMPAMRVPQGGRSWRWAAPAGAIAAGLLVWVFVREMTPPKVAPQPATTTIADNRTPAPPPPVTDQLAISRETPPQSAASPRVEQRASTALKEIEPKRRDYDRKDAAAQAQTLPAPTQAAPPPVVSADVAKQAETNNGLRDQAVAAANEKKEAADAELGQFMKQQRQAASAPASAPTEEALRKTQQNQVAKSVGGRLITSEVAGQAKQERNYQKLKAGSLIPVISSDGKSVWRFGDDGSISNSQDQGRHWQSQTSGVAAQILAGSAPTDQVCWAVGTGGTILRTLDGGAHWTKISSPISSDLGAVQASDDSHAQIWDLSRQLSYETRDGGTTWKQIAHQ
jgi:hypothetical protein